MTINKRSETASCLKKAFKINNYFFNIAHNYYHVISGINWTTFHVKSACPHKRKRFEEEEERSKLSESEKSRESEKTGESDKVEDGISDPSYRKIPGTSPYTTPDQSCTICFIPMQDSFASCYCEPKPKLPPCPPKDGPDEPREPVCGCDLCKKNPNHEKCCEKSKTLRGITVDRERFEKA